MIGEETVEAARKWCQVGANWIENGAVKLGLNYLDRAIAVFNQNDELAWQTYARHAKLDGLKRTGWEAEAEALADTVMGGYAELGDAYGQALLLIHLAECMALQQRQESALVKLNLAAAIAESVAEKSLLAHVCAERAKLYAERENLVLAIRQYRRAETLLEEDGLETGAWKVRYSAAEAMVRLGERADAIAFLEDLQTRFLRGRHFREALEPLNLLGRLYEESGSWDEKSRIGELIHLCGQNIVKSGDGRREANAALPTIRLFDSSRE